MRERIRVMLALAAAAATSPAMAAELSAPQSLEEIWRFVQAQQTEIEALRQENAAMKRRIETSGELQETVIEPRVVEYIREAYDPDNRYEVYGTVQADAIYDFGRVDPDWNDASRPSKIPVQDKRVFGDDGEAIISPRQSRFGSRTYHKTSIGDFSTWIEFDLFAFGNDAGEVEPNTRHLWVEWGEHWGFGQTDSNFMDIDIFPNTIDYWGATGMAFVRKPHIRYKQTVGDAGSFWAVALEDPSSDVDAGDVREIDPDLADALQPKDSLPDFSARWRGEHNWGHYQVAGLLRKLEVETASDGLGGNPNNTPKEDTLGWGLNLTSVLNVGRFASGLGRDQLKLGLIFGEGIASYFNDGGTAIGLKIGGLEPVESLGLVAYYDHYWDAHWSTSIGWSMHQQDNTELQSSDAYERGQIAQANLLYSYENFLTGIEAIWMQRENNNGEDNDDFRIQYSLKYSFSRKL